MAKLLVWLSYYKALFFVEGEFIFINIEPVDLELPANFSINNPKSWGDFDPGFPFIVLHYDEISEGERSSTCSNKISDFAIASSDKGEEVFVEMLLTALMVTAQLDMPEFRVFADIAIYWARTELSPDELASLSGELFSFMGKFYTKIREVTDYG